MRKEQPRLRPVYLRLWLCSFSLQFVSFCFTYLLCTPACLLDAPLAMCPSRTCSPPGLGLDPGHEVNALTYELPTFCWGKHGPQ